MGSWARWTRWIRTDEKMPGPGTYFVTRRGDLYANNLKTGAMYCFVDIANVYISADDYDADSEEAPLEWSRKDVIAWQPLPEPYKAEE